MRKTIWAVVLVFTLGPALALAEVSAEGAWLREPVPGRDVTAGYLVLNNAGQADATLVGVSSAAAERVEMHSHTQGEDGMMRMRQQDSVPVPAGGERVFEPGGYHLMLFGLAEGLSAGDTVELTLAFEDDSEQTVSAEVRGLTGHAH